MTSDAETGAAESGRQSQIESLFTEAIQLEAAGRPDHADAVANQLDAVEPAAGALLRANLSARRGNLRKALKATGQGLEYDEGSYWLLRMRSEILMAMERFREAIDTLETIEMTFKPALDVVCDILKCWAAIRLEDAELANDYSLQITGALSGVRSADDELAPLAAKGWEGAAVAALMYGKSDDVHMYAAQAQSLLPVTNPGLTLLRAQAFLQADETDAALQLNNALFEEFPDDKNVIAQRLSILRSQGDEEGADALFEQTRERGWDGLRFSVNLNFRLGEWAKAKAEFAKTDTGYDPSFTVSLPLHGLGDPLAELFEKSADDAPLTVARGANWFGRLLLVGYPGIAAIIGFVGWEQGDSVLLWAPVATGLVTVALSFVPSRGTLVLHSMSATTAALFGLGGAFVASLPGDRTLPVPWYVWVLAVVIWLAASTRNQAFILHNFRRLPGMIALNSYFGHRDQRVQSAEFSGGAVQIVFGSVTLDLSECEVSRRPANLRIAVFFGALKVIVPYHWIVMGTDVDGLNNPPMRFFPIQPGQRPHLRLSGNVSMGKVEIEPIVDDDS
jgi:tetratricopeptide (TPR) repeat protein